MISLRQRLTLLASAWLVLFAASGSGRGQDATAALSGTAASARRVVDGLADDAPQDETEAARQTLRDLLATADGWLVADELRVARLTPEAIRIAELTGGPDLARLPEYLRSVADTPPDEGARGALAAYGAATATGDWDAAEQALVPAQEQGDGLERARLALALGDVHRERRAYDDAMHLYDTAARRCRAIGWLRGADLALNRRLLAARGALRWDAAEDSVRRVIAVQSERSLPRLAARSRTNLGNVLLMAGDMRGAAEEFERAVDALRDLGSPKLGWAQRSLGWAYLQVGRYGDAQMATQDAIATLGRTGPPSAVRDAELQLAAVHQELGLYDAAEAVQRRVLAAAGETGEPRLAALAQGGLGVTLLRLGRLPEARDLLRQAHDHFVALGDDRSSCQALVNLANVHRQANELDVARQRSEQALQAAERLGDPWLECNVLQDLALVVHGLGDARRGYEYLARADEIAARSASQRLIGDGAYFRARMALDDGDVEVAVASSRIAIGAAGERIQGLADEESAEARQRNAEVYATAARAGIAADDPAVLFDFLEAGRAGTLLESLENRADVREAHIAEDALGRLEAATRDEARATAYYRRLASARSRTPLRKLREARDELAAATEARVAAVRAIQRRAVFAADLLYPTPATLPEAQAALGDGEVLVIFALLEPDAYALVVERDDARIVPLGSTARLAETCSAPEWRDEKRDADDALARLRRAAVDPLKLDAAARRLLVSPDGALYQAPFQAIVGEREVSLVPSATTYLRLADRATEPSERALVVGDPDYSDRRELVQLPGGREEAKLFHAGEGRDVVLIGRDAKESRVRTELSAGEAWRVVHLAAHGREDAERPMRSGIALATGAADDGWLTAAEVYPLQFSADLVTLSACESGGGRVYRGEGLVGLTRAFLFAGSQRVVCSLWRVDDEATRALMARFYEIRNQQGASVAAALAGAQRHVRSQKGWEHPYYWAGWTVWGLGT